MAAHPERESTLARQAEMRQLDKWRAKLQESGYTGADARGFLCAAQLADDSLHYAHVHG